MHLASNTPTRKARPGAGRSTRRQLPDDERPGVAALLQVQLLLDPDGLRICRDRNVARPRLVDRQQDLHDAVLQQQNYNGVTSVTATSATDKVETATRKYGNNLPLVYVSDQGVFRTGLWSDTRRPNRYQTPSDPRTWVECRSAKLS